MGLAQIVSASCNLIVLNNIIRLELLAPQSNNNNFQQQFMLVNFKSVFAFFALVHFRPYSQLCGGESEACETTQKYANSCSLKHLFDISQRYFNAAQKKGIHIVYAANKQTMPARKRSQFPRPSRLLTLSVAFRTSAKSNTLCSQQLTYFCS